MERPKSDLQAKIRQLAAIDARLPRPAVRAGEPPEMPGNWEVQAVNVDDKTAVNPEQTSISRTVVLQSITYVNTRTGETITSPIVPKP
jgi:hypothetical protein